jgi:hypothetical protein
MPKHEITVHLNHVSESLVEKISRFFLQKNYISIQHDPQSEEILEIAIRIRGVQYAGENGTPGMGEVNTPPVEPGGSATTSQVGSG